MVSTLQHFYKPKVALSKFIRGKGKSGGNNFNQIIKNRKRETE